MYVDRDAVKVAKKHYNAWQTDRVKYETQDLRVRIDPEHVREYEIEEEIMEILISLQMILLKTGGDHALAQDLINDIVESVEPAKHEPFNP